MARWHTVKSGGRFDESQDDREFRNQGPLVSISREPPQNSTDNPLDRDSPVVVRYSLRELPSTSQLRERFLPQNPWVDHVSLPKNRRVTTYREEYDESLLDAINDSVRVLLIEDYNATGLIGDPEMLYPKSEGEGAGNYSQESQDNTFFWFMRSRGAQRPVSGRGGSWGLGKLAFPLASSVRTFFVATTRVDGSRYLSGQAILKKREYRQRWWDEMMYYAEDELITHDIHGKDEHYWRPISDSDIIDEFCNTFKIERGEDQPGTSIAVVLPKKGLSAENLTLAILCNYCVPIMSGNLEIEISKEDGIVERITSSNIHEFISNSDWEKIPRRDIAAATTSGKMNELANLYEAIIYAEVNETPKLVLGRPSRNKKPNTTEQFERVLPSRDSEELTNIRDAFLANQAIVVRGDLPVHHKDERGVENGQYYLVFRKCEDEKDAEAHFYRDHISLPLNLDRKPASPGVSSLLVVSSNLPQLNPLAELLRSSEGPAHLKWETREEGMKERYHYGPSTIGFMKDIVGKIVSRITSVDTKKEDIWTDIFSLGEKPKPPEIERRFRIDEHEDGGCTIKPLETKEDLVGVSFIIRAGYPKPFNLKVKKPPDPRAIDIHQMSWKAEGATITKDVLASNGELCVDRVRMTIDAPEFEVELLGVDTELKAQVIVTEESGL